MILQVNYQISDLSTVMIMMMVVMMVMTMMTITIILVFVMIMMMIMTVLCNVSLYTTGFLFLSGDPAGWYRPLVERGTA